MERNDEEVCARVISVRQYNTDEIPYPLDKMKSIIEKVSEHFNPDYEVIDCKNFYGDDVILSYTLSGALMEFENTLMIINKKENNIIVNDKLVDDSIRFTIPYDDIKRIKNIIKNNDKLFNIKGIPIPPVLDGSMHEFYLSTKNNIISLVTWNLWYWLEEEEMPKEVKIIISIINEINKILMQYDLKIDIGDN